MKFQISVMPKVCIGNTTTNNKFVVECKDKLELTDIQPVRKCFLFLRHRTNIDYISGLKTVRLRSCLIHNKAAAENGIWILKTKPKWFTDLLQTNFSTETGEILSQAVYTTDCLTSGNYRKIKAVNAFCGHFKELYAARQVSLFFYTFTLANQAAVTIKAVMDTFRKRLERRNIKLHGYVWILQISDDLHVHYHALIATDRINCKGGSLPEFLKLNDVWRCRCQVEFIKRSLKYYLATYFTKNKSRIVGKRQYGLKLPKKTNFTLLAE